MELQSIKLIIFSPTRFNCLFAACFTTRLVNHNFSTVLARRVTIEDDLNNNACNRCGIHQIVY